MFDWFEKWNLVAEYEASFVGSGLFNKGEEVNVIFAFFEKPSGARKIKIIGGKDSFEESMFKAQEPKTYKWLKYNGALPESTSFFKRKEI